MNQTQFLQKQFRASLWIPHVFPVYSLAGFSVGSFLLTHPHTYYLKYPSQSITFKAAAVFLFMKHTHIDTQIKTVFLQVLKALFSKIHPLSSHVQHCKFLSLFYFLNQSIHVYSVSCSLELWRDTLNGWSF